MKGTRRGILTAIAVLILVAATPSAVRDTIETGRLYLFSRQFIEELSQRFTGPGRLRQVDMGGRPAFDWYIPGV